MKSAAAFALLAALLLAACRVTPVVQRAVHFADGSRVSQAVLAEDAAFGYSPARAEYYYHARSYTSVQQALAVGTASYALRGEARQRFLGSVRIIVLSGRLQADFNAGSATLHLTGNYRGSVVNATPETLTRDASETSAYVFHKETPSVALDVRFHGAAAERVVGAGREYSVHTLTNSLTFPYTTVYGFQGTKQ